MNGWTDSPDAIRNQGLDYGRRALRAAANDPFILTSAALVFGYFREDMAAAIVLMDRSLAANPSSAYGWLFSGVLRFMAGQPDIAIEHVERSMRLNPRDRLAAPLTPIGGAYLMKRTSTRRSQICKHRSRNAPASPCLTVSSRHVTPIWDGSMTRAKSSSVCVCSPRSSFRPPFRFATPNTASFSFLACGWPWVRQNDRRQFGDAVNLAARLEALAKPRAICASTLGGALSG
jgi:tetratricopeptide (TPR) repeat protein